MTTDVLLILGPGAVVVFVTVLALEGARRPGYDARYHTGSELELGERGWVMRTNFVVIAAGMAAFAVGVHRTLDTLAGAVLLGVAAAGFLAAGLFVPDPVRGYPPGASTRGGRPMTLHAKLHDVTGPVIFVSLLAAFVAVAARLDGGWQLYTVLTVVVGAVLVTATIIAYRSDAARTGLVQRSLVHFCLLWVAVVGIALPAGAI